ncbi:YoaK family protein [Sinosporangium siamense]|uniref:UPF0700 transmembrane protein YoaK n=1 Tax=Sinosporangium siamense TaxID=1367973 RepID=A0A919REB5_9ACTN|nr:YoaK family protein [Sinosporangium siamense]GII92320.1 UPF0700 transmembrane protein YoaK [Sinosporangium siamense]
MTAEVENRPPPGSVAVRRARLRAGLLVALTFGAGATDIVGFLGLNQVFTANMTGNIVLLGLAASQAQWFEFALCAAATLAFAAGLLGGFLAIGQSDLQGMWPSRVTAALGADLVLQAAFWVGWALNDAQPRGYMILILVVLSSAAMGVQTAAARRLAVAGVTTTFVTGTMTSVMAGLAAKHGEATLLRTVVIVSLAAGAAVAGALFAVAPLGAALIGPLSVAVVIGMARLARLHRAPDLAESAISH